MFFFAELRFAGENFKAETSSNFSKGWYTDLKGIFQQRPNVSISQKNSCKKNRAGSAMGPFPILMVAGSVFLLGGILAFLVSVSFVYHLLQGCLPGTLGKILRT